MNPQFEHDRRLTLENRKKLATNRNLLHWYKELYQFIFAGIEDLAARRILEIGSGMSPARQFVPGLITSDILELDYLDHAFDCHEIDRYAGIPDGSLDIITFTNVLHHLNNPLRFLERSHAKLAPGGMIILVEPYLSVISTLIYRYIHHELLDTAIAEPVLNNIEGPLTSANSALPYMIFFSGRGWDRTLRQYYDFNASEARFFTGLAYMATGGISRVLPIPAGLYRMLFRVDQWLATSLPDVYSSFFVLRLVKKGGQQ